MNQVLPGENVEFFESMKDKINEFEKRLSNWEKVDPKKFCFAKNLVEKEVTELQNLKKYIKEVKIYIIFMGTMSSGKSTFINSLLGQQILPSRNQECTKQFLFISHGENLKIDQQEYGTLEEVEKKLHIMQQEQQSDRVDVQTKSSFHQQFPKDLRSRIIFVDTYNNLIIRPGVKTGEDELQNPIQKLSQILDDKEMRINIWISDYSHFDNDKKKIFYLLQETQNQFSKQIDQNLANQQLIKEENNYLEKLFFVMNKIDTRKKDEDQNLDEVISEIREKVGNDHFIYKISSLRALYYRIMNLGEKMAQEKFIKSFYENFQDDHGFENINQCREHCIEKIQKNQQLLKNQEYTLFSDQISQQIKTNILTGFQGNSYKQVISSDTYLMLIFNVNKEILIESDEDKKQLQIIIPQILNRILDYDSEIQFYLKDCLLKLSEAIKKNQQELISQEVVIEQLQKVCSETLQLHNKLKQDIIGLNRKHKVQIFKLISDLKVDSNIKQELLQSCQKIYSGFNETQANNIGKQQTNQFSQSEEQFFQEILQKLGIQITKYDNLKKVITHALRWGLIMWNANLANRALALVAAAEATGLLVAGGGFVLTGIGGMYLAKIKFGSKQFTSIEIVKAHLTQLHESLKNQITQLCADNIKNNELTLQGLQFLFNQLIQA